MGVLLACQVAAKLNDMKRVWPAAQVVAKLFTIADPDS